MLLSTVIALFQVSAAQADEPSLRAARRAQAHFETVRRANLPWNRHTGSAQCDAVIGRFCYWYDSMGVRRPPEPRTITAARDELLGVLDTAANAGADNSWVVGQRVRYLIEAERASEAVEAARECRSEPWRCAAFEGLALHVGGRHREADSLFELALAAMPADQRCEWLDARTHVEGMLHRELGRAACPEREALSNRLFRWSAPLWSVAGNDLRSEHLSRLTMAEILSKSANAHGMVWSGDSRELMVRYGWSEWFTRTGDDAVGLQVAPRIHGHDREPSYRFFPEIVSARALPALDSASWRFRDPLARSRYAPRYLERIRELPHQTARLPRGDSMLVAIAYRATDTTLARDTVQAALMVRADGDAEPFAAGASVAGTRGALLATLPRRPQIASAEVRGKATARAARARYTLDPLPCNERSCLSDLLLFAPGSDSIGRGLASVLPAAAAELSFSRRQPLGVYWEVELPDDTRRSVWFSLTVEPVEPGVMRRVATRLRIARRAAPVHVRWQAVLSSARAVEQVTLRLPPSARGQHRVTLTLEGADLETMTSHRDIEVRP